MKATLMSIRPEWVAKILNGEKTIEIRKKFPKDYVGWVYIYVTKQGILAKIKNVWRYIKGKNYNPYFGYQGKVVARFWCDKVEEHRPFFHWCIEKETCLTCDDVLDYLDSKDKSVGNPKRQDKVYAIRITKLEIFDKPKEISEFMKVSCKGCPFENTQTCHNNTDGRYCKLTRAPQSWCYVEI